MQSVLIITGNFWELLFLSFVGVVLHILSKIKERIDQERAFDFKFRLQLSISVIMSMLISFILVYSRNEIKEFLPMTTLIAAMTGYMAQSIFAKLISVKMKPTKTSDTSTDEEKKEE